MTVVFKFERSSTCICARTGISTRICDIATYERTFETAVVLVDAFKVHIVQSMPNRDVRRRFRVLIFLRCQPKVSDSSIIVPKVSV